MPAVLYISAEYCNTVFKTQLKDAVLSWKRFHKINRKDKMKDVTSLFKYLRSHNWVESDCLRS